MKRKLIRQGSREHGSFTITLPSRWVKRFDLKPGDEIEVKEVANSLSISPEKEFVASAVVTINARGYELSQIKRHLAEAYRSGAEAIQIFYEDVILSHKKTGRTVRLRDEIEFEVSSELLGMEIEKITQNLIVIKQFSEAIEEEFETAFRKIFFKLQDQVDQAIYALQTMEPERLHGVWLTDRGVNKFCNFCMRILNKRGDPDHKKLMRLAAALVQLEFLGDLIYLIPMNVLKLKIKKIRPEFINLFNDFKTALNHYTRYFYDRKEEHTVMLLKLREKLYESKKLFKQDSINSMLLARLEFCFDVLVNLVDSALSNISPEKNK